MVCQHAHRSRSFFHLLPLCAAFWTGALRAEDETRHWAYLPLSRQTAPEDTTGWARNDIDRWVHSSMSKAGLTPAPEASREVLLRRLSFDLLGLPPTPQELEAFLSDEAPMAYERLLERLLASPHYGERWGRHWLDLARYADTSGDGADAPVPEAYQYRDYVIECFNQDMPLDVFLKEQIAGDLLVRREPGVRERERLVATTYVGLTRRFNNGEYRDMHLVIENSISTIGKGVLAMSIGCARCHDHKFDPIPTRDYYALYGFFESTQYPHAGTESGRMRKNFTELPGGGLAYAVFDKTKETDIRDARIQRAGDPGSPGDTVPRGFLSILRPEPAQIPKGESGRLQLAEWLTADDNPLTPRVMANRIWQYHFGRGIVETSSTFGQQGSPPTHLELLDALAIEFREGGWSFKHLHRLICLSSTYRQSSSASEATIHKDPSNQWLARYPRRRLEAEPMRDAVLRISGQLQPGSPGAHPFPKPNSKNEYPYTQHNPFAKDYSSNHRAVYLPSRRLGKHPYMELFNGPDPNECTARRTVSTVPLQALYWMNSDFIGEQAGALADRLLADPEATTEARLEHACRLVYGRPAADEERNLWKSFLTDQYQRAKEHLPGSTSPEKLAWKAFCRALFASNEFVYVD